MTYNLTETQKQIVRRLVKARDDGQVTEMYWWAGGYGKTPTIHLDDAFGDVDATRGDLHALAGDQLIFVRFDDGHGSGSVELLQRAWSAVQSDFADHQSPSIPTISASHGSAVNVTLQTGNHNKATARQDARTEEAGEVLANLEELRSQLASIGVTTVDVASILSDLMDALRQYTSAVAEGKPKAAGVLDRINGLLVNLRPICDTYVAVSKFLPDKTK